MNKSAFNLDENIAAALSYVVGIVTGIIFLVVEKENKFVRFHAMQSVLLSVLLIIVNIALNILRHIPLIGFVAGMASWLVSVAAFVLFIFLIIKAYQKETYKLPVLGDVAESQISK